MPPPIPLTQCPAPSLDWSRADTPAATDFGDIYFSTDGGLEETKAVFLQGCGLPKAWEDQAVFTISELGFGSGLNFLACWQLWNTTAKADQRLHFLSIEKYPFSQKDLKQALKVWPELSELAEHLIKQWPGRVRGFHRLDFGSVQLTLIHEDIDAALDQVSNLKSNAWFLDGFSPSKNSDMWSPSVLKRIGENSANHARLASFSVAGSVRTGLIEAGFDVFKKSGFGRKRHRLEAVYSKPIQHTPIDPDRVLIVGAGIAGRSLARALEKRHIAYDLIDSGDHPSASGNPAALVKPRFDLQDRAESRFFLSSYLYALKSYDGPATIETGILQIPKTDAETKRFQKLVTQNPLGDGHLDYSEKGLFIASARIIDPALIFSDLDIKKQKYDPSVDDKYSHIIFAAGYGIHVLAPELEMRYSRGQLSWASQRIEHPIAYGGYAIPLGSQSLVGATHDRLDAGDPFEIRPDDDEKNIAAYANITGETLNLSSKPSRASVRVTTKNTMPQIAKLGDKKWALTGLGSRGFTYAPLLAEALIAKICNEVAPLEKALIAQVFTETTPDD